MRRQKICPNKENTPSCLFLNKYHFNKAAHIFERFGLISVS